MRVETGIIPRFSREKYDRLDRVNWSSLKHLARSPAHYRHKLLEKDPDTDARKLGRAIHLAALEPERFRSETAVWSDGRRFGKKWDAFCAKNEGLELLKEDEQAHCLAVQQAVRNHPTAQRYLQQGQGEVSVFWTHERPELGGLPGFSIEAKARIDFLAADALVDLKTTRDASPEGFAKESWRYRYHSQAAYYVDGFEAATGRRLPYVIVAVESSSPYVVQVYRVPDAVLDLGREEYRALLERLNYCRTNALWPGYGDGELELALPGWATGYADDDVTGLDLQFDQGENA